MQDAFEICEREYALYPEPRIHSLMVGLYNEGLFCIAEIYKLSLGTSESAKSRFKQALRDPGLIGDRSAIQRNAERIKSFSQKVAREVEYYHRRELRQAHLRLVEVDKKQNQVLKALEEQQKILASLQEEQKLLASVTDYQKVLQKLQELLARLPKPSEPVEVAFDLPQPA
jgi:hypothetical protein